MDTAEYDTNTLLVANIASVAFRIYEFPADSPPRSAAAALDVENTLREQGHIVLYDAARRALWNFGLVGKEGHQHVTSPNLATTLDLCGLTLALGDEGTLEPTALHKNIQTPTTGSVSGASVLDQPPQRSNALAAAPQPQEHDARPGDAAAADAKPTCHKVVYEAFITAVLLSVSVTFCNRFGAIPLNYRTVLLPPEPSEADDLEEAAADQCPALATLRAYLTTTGTLVVSFGVSACQGLMSLSDRVSSHVSLSGTPILAAPLGTMARNHSLAVGDQGSSSLAQTPNTQALSFRGGPDIYDSLWKQACLKILRLRGVALKSLSDCPWVNLFVSRPKLQDAKTDARRQALASSVVTMPWPGPLCFRKRVVEVPTTSRVGDNLVSGHEENHDPLGSARGWFNSAPEREERLSRRRAERAAAAKEANSADARPSRPGAQSPAMVRRPSATGASAIYPTPPDGVQHANGVTPSFDGALSSPGNAVAVAPPTEGTEPAPSGTAEGFGVASDFGEPKRQRHDCNLLGDTDHMFGDMGGDMFGDDDITDADFSFFDEAPGGVDMGPTLADSAAVAADDVAKAAPSNTTDAVKEEAAPDGDAAVFAKPELKHARSSRNAAMPQHDKDARPGSLKREPSPLDPHSVFKRVRASLTQSGRNKNDTPLALARERTVRAFESMSFDAALPVINKKYEQGGQFDYRRLSSAEKPRIEPGLLPETDYLKRRGRRAKKLRDRCLEADSLLKTATGLEPLAAKLSPGKMEACLSEDDDSSVGSDEDGSSYTTEEPTSPVKSSVKMTAADDDVGSQVTTSLRDGEALEEADQQLAADLGRLARPDAAEVPLSQLFCDPDPLNLDLSLGDEELMQVAQILTDQAATGSLDICGTRRGATCKAQQERAGAGRRAMQVLRESVPALLKGAAPASLKGLVDVADVALLGQGHRMQPRAVAGRDANGEPARPSNLYQMAGPHLEVRRADVKLSVLPSAVRFWESLGLGPSSGPKNVKAVCVFPGWSGMADNVKTFLGRLKSMYEVLKLGSLDSMPLSADMEPGVLPYEVDRISTWPDATTTGHGSALVESTETLRAAMDSLVATETNVVVYYVYSPSNPGAIVEACAAFERLLGSYARQAAATKELVLQLVSAEAVSSPTSVVVTSGAQLVGLCMETYDRCTLFGGPMPAPAMRLEQPLPRIIDFKLTVSPSASLMRENSCIHVAYAQSVDERWVTAAWTDDRGNQQETASYCLGRRGRPASRPMREVADEIWRSTLELIAAWRVHWRIVITKCGPMDQQETDMWTELSRGETAASVTAILLAVDTRPSLQLLAPAVKVQVPAAPLYATPVSTPQASMVSPEQSGTPATPGAEGAGAGEGEGDAVLVDVTDQTWGAIVGHRLSNSSSVLELRPALMSGYLIKRTGARVEDAPVAMEVNLVHTEASARAHEALLREMLSHFGGLGTLARARGVVEREADVRPWHVAAAEKGVRAVYLLM